MKRSRKMLLMEEILFPAKVKGNYHHLHESFLMCSEIFGYETFRKLSPF
jgi:hypothetical protein